MAVRAIGQKKGKRGLLATVDYTLAKRALLVQMRTGLLSRADICEPSRRDCPVCAGAKLRLLAYVFGDGLRENNGRVWPLDVGLSMAADRPGSWCYVVEVCTECQWNHLSEAFAGPSDLGTPPDPPHPSRELHTRLRRSAPWEP
jgi:hypothetical protein